MKKTETLKHKYNIKFRYYFNGKSFDSIKDLTNAVSEYMKLKHY